MSDRRRLILSLAVAVTSALAAYTCIRMRGRSPKKVQQRPPVHVYYGTQSGTAQAFAEELVRDLNGRGTTAKLQDLEQWKPAAWVGEEGSPNLPETQMSLDDPESLHLDTDLCQWAILIVSTYGDGEPPDGCLNFFRYIGSKKRERRCLSHVKFAVFGLGSTEYTHFNAAAKKLQRHLIRLGGVQIVPSHMGDDAGDIELDWKRWKEGTLLPFLDGVLPPSGITAPASPSNRCDSESAFVRCSVTGVHELMQDSSEVTTKLVTFEADSPLSYGPGDSFALQPRLAHDLALRRMATLSAIVKPTGWIVTEEDWLVVKQSRLQLDELVAILSLDPKQAMSHVSAPSPRYYSVCNPGRCEIAVVQHVYDRPPLDSFYALLMAKQLPFSRIPKRSIQATGLVSTSLCNAKIGEGFQVKVCRGLDLQIDGPLLCVATGTGVAPFRALWRSSKQLLPSVPRWLLYGIRDQEKDWLFKEEMSRGVPYFTKVQVCTSRQAADDRPMPGMEVQGPVRVTGALLSLAEDVWDTFLAPEAGGTLILCGSREMCTDVIAWVRAVGERRGFEDFHSVMMREKRLKMELFW
ncbi:MAG: uncharacterized protein KVP18_001185 [Porospora cf. gigantea A]|uniref:uncharacterized protein n=1 Tax=Porospora cf. gigantea A TaxID=2853593 RepID=UPI00355A1086|nr:MAG: hypothetical protein KVP18_001185 [Porospora cf. gigantea A]